MSCTANIGRKVIFEAVLKSVCKKNASEKSSETIDFLKRYQRDKFSTKFQATKTQVWSIGQGSLMLMNK